MLVIPLLFHLMRSSDMRVECPWSIGCSQSAWHDRRRWLQLRNSFFTETFQNSRTACTLGSCFRYPLSVDALVCRSCRIMQVVAKRWWISWRETFQRQEMFQMCSFHSILRIQVTSTSTSGSASCFSQFHRHNDASELKRWWSVEEWETWRSGKRRSVVESSQRCLEILRSRLLSPRPRILVVGPSSSSLAAKAKDFMPVRSFGAFDKQVYSIQYTSTTHLHI